MPRDPNIEKANPVKLSVIEISLSKIAVSISSAMSQPSSFLATIPALYFSRKRGFFTDKKTF
jgi:hypothetical protein